jgi:gas vesicle protein
VLRDIQAIGALVPPTTAMLYSPYMATKTQTKKRKATLDSVLSTVERGFADLEGKMERGFAAVAEDITDIKSKMATKEDLAAVETRLDRRIEKLDTKLTKFEDHEIDKRLQLEVRVSAVEKHLGLDKKIAA